MELDAAELAEALDDALLVVTRTGEIHHANRLAEQLLQRPRDELVSRRLSELPVVGFSLACSLAEALTRDGGELRTTAPGADSRPLAVRVIIRTRFAWIFIHPVERARVEAPPPTSTQPLHTYLRNILQHTPLVLFSIDKRGIFTMSEGRALDRLGRTPNEANGQSLFDLYGDIPWICDAARRALAGEPVSTVGEVRGVVFESHYGPIHDGEGRVTGVIGVALDVTDRERAIDKLAAQQSVLKYILANVPQAIFWKDRHGRFLGCNHQFLRHTGVAAEDSLLGRTDRELWDNREEVEFFEQVDERVMSTTVPMLNIEESLLRPDGRQTYLLTSKVPIRDEANQVTGILGIFVDITERKHIEIELQAAKEAADAALRAKSEFLTVMSHELRTPLALVLGPLESLLATAEGLDDRLHEALTRVWRNASRLGRLVDDILDYQKLEAGQMQVSWEPVDVRGLVEGIVLDAEPAARSAGIGLRLHLALDAPTVPLDRRMFEKILLNLLGNALKFTPAGGTVTVILARSDVGFELAVDDTGPGIPVDEQERVFQRFQQLDSSTTRRYEGTGLGLAIVRDFAEKMGGRVTLRSELGLGSRFAVELPIDPDRLVEAPAPGTPRRTPRLALPEPLTHDLRAAAINASQLPHILVVEDNPDMRGYLEEILGSDHAVTTAATGAAALRAAPDLHLDAIVSDVMMPEMDGYELVARLKSDPLLREIPVILLSAKASRQEAVQGLDVGADDYLPKPFAPDELRARVRAAVRLRRSHLEIQRKNEALEHALQSLKDAQDQLVQSSKMAAVGTLVAGLSHELNNPIAIIRMSAQMLLRRGSRDPFIRRTLERIERHSQRCARLVSALLAYARGRPQMAERCDLGPTLTWLIDLVRPEADERGLRLVAAFNPHSLPALVVNRPALESALLNVIGNAADATPRGGTIEVAARELAGDDRSPGVEVVVQDTGSGIAPEDLPHVFEPFFTTKAPGKGTGLGLPMTYKFIRSQGGTVRVDSEVGRGTAVRIWLPLAPPAPGSEAESVHQLAEGLG